MAESDSVPSCSTTTTSAYSSVDPGASSLERSNEELGDHSDQSSHDSPDSDTDDVVEKPQPGTVPSLLARLRAATASELARKCKCASNPPSGKQRSRGSNSAGEPKSIKPVQHVREYSTEPFIVSNNTLFCRGCREELSVKKSSIKNHCYSSKHLEGKRRLEKQQSRDHDIADVLLAYNKEVNPRGDTPSKSAGFSSKSCSYLS